MVERPSQNGVLFNLTLKEISKEGVGTISHAQAVEKATEEYQKYQVQNLSPVEEESFYILYKYAY